MFCDPDEAMSPGSYQLFNIWFPALVSGLVVGVLAAALWDILRRPTWFFIASRFWPGILKAVGLDNPNLSRADVKAGLREVNEMLSSFESRITKTLLPGRSSMATNADPTAAKSSASNPSISSNRDAGNDCDVEAQADIIPPCSSSLDQTPFKLLTYFPGGTSKTAIRPVKKFLRSHSMEPVRQWKSSTIFQASLPIDPCVLAQIGELARNCLHVESRCTFQLGSWAIIYCNGESLRILTS